MPLHDDETHIPVHSSRIQLDTELPDLAATLRTALPRDGAISTRSFDRVVSAVDASHYLLTPRAIVTPNSLAEIAALFAFATETNCPVTIRSGGTSLSGQASTRHILMDTRRHFRSLSVESDGTVVRAGAGTTVRQINMRLLRYGRKLGPDPASEIACTVGGVVANNSSGMACGTKHNAYQTLRSAVIVLPSGTLLDTGNPDADAELLRMEPQLHTALTELRDRVIANPSLVTEIARQFSIKNTMGYGLNALLDHHEPAQILAHLMVGSEGTLGFVAEATFDTVPLHPHAATALLIFDSLSAATDALVQVISTEPATVELMDAASLRAAKIDPESREVLPAFPIDHHCALLVEYQAATDSELTTRTTNAYDLFAGLRLTEPPQISRDSSVRASLWHVRKGLYATVAGSRPAGTTALLEDVAVPVARLSELCNGLSDLFTVHGYVDAVVFGHAKDGNIHFLITEDFTDPQSLARYQAFTEELVELVLSAGGTLKAEHGTGRIMAPFVERQYGAALYGIMLAIKRAVDPAGILNPDVILTSDPLLHLRDLKTTPLVESEIDRCVECGYCEPVCPSKDLTTTPRQRIVVSRAIAQADVTNNVRLAHELRQAQRYDVIDTCAVDGMCQTACPVLINTGDLVRRLRTESVGGAQKAIWNTASRAWAPTTRAASLALTAASGVPPLLISAPNALARALLGTDAVPMWSPDLPRGGRSRVRGFALHEVSAVYFQACVGSIFGPSVGGGVTDALERLSAEAGIGLTRPDGIDGLCCGTPWKSKGMVDGYEHMVERLASSLWRASKSGEIPIVCDNSSCTEGLIVALQSHLARHPERGQLRILDAVDFVAQHMLPHLQITRRVQRVVVHPTCSSTRAGSNSNLSRLAAAVATEVVVPDEWGCCAFAGDRGLLHPELTATATRAESAAVSEIEADAYVSCNRTCEIGMTRATGRPYRHVLELVAESVGDTLRWSK